MPRTFIATALMLGNFVVGTSVLAPAGLLGELALGLDVTVHQASYLITFGAVVLCFGSPLLSWLTSRMDRRRLLAGSLAIIALAHVASAFADSFALLLALRLVMLAAAAPFTPQAAGVIGLIVPADKRAGAITYAFLGWSLAAAAGLPGVTFVASRFGWRAAFAGIAVLAAVSLALLLWRLPGGLRTPPVDLRTWAAVARNRTIRLLLLLTASQTAGQLLIYTFLGPLLIMLTGAGADAIGLAFATYGVMGLVGNVIASRVVGDWGAFRTSLVFTSAMFIGVCVWSLGAGVFPAMVVGIAIWGLGFAASNSMQQARLIGAAPALGGASVALNTSALYIGQAVGSGIGGLLFAQGQFVAMGYVASGFLLAALGVLLLTRRG